MYTIYNHLSKKSKMFMFMWQSVAIIYEILRFNTSMFKTYVETKQRH